MSLIIIFKKLELILRIIGRQMDESSYANIRTQFLNGVRGDRPIPIILTLNPFCYAYTRKN